MMQKQMDLYSDYVNLIERLIGLGDDDELIKEKIEKILDDIYTKTI